MIAAVAIPLNYALAACIFCLLVGFYIGARTVREP